MGSLNVGFILAVVIATTLSAPEVQLTSGRVQGSDNSADNSGKPYFSYFGVPFAQPPVGDLRFERPVPYVGTGPSTLISSATHGPACMQRSYNGPMSEDCLQLNIYTPADIATPPGDTRPLKKVMVWIHGGVFVKGTGEETRPSQIVTEYDVIVVSTQYRVAGFGFISTPGNSALPGNTGLYDNIMALQWVKDNIAQFGGDPDDVTLWGQSAGGVITSLLSLSPLSKGLFTKSIIMSHTPIVDRAPLKNFDIMAEETGCMPWFRLPRLNPFHYQFIIKCLKSKPAADINLLPQILRFTARGPIAQTQFPSFNPVVDGELVPYDPALLLGDRNYLREAGVLDRSYIVGKTNADGKTFLFLPFGVPLTQALQLDNVKGIIDTAIDGVFRWSSPSAAQVAMATLEYAYPLGAANEANAQGMVDLIDDTIFLLPAMTFADSIIRASNTTDVFLYSMDHLPKLKDPTSPFVGVRHSVDLFYMFDITPIMTASRLAAYADIPNPRSEPVWDVITGAFTTFAKTGNPSRVGQAGGTITWPSYDQQAQSYLSIADAPQVKTRLASKRLAMWTDFMPGLAKPFWHRG